MAEHKQPSRRRRRTKKKPSSDSTLAARAMDAHTTISKLAQLCQQVIAWLPRVAAEEAKPDDLLKWLRQLKRLIGRAQRTPQDVRALFRSIADRPGYSFWDGDVVPSAHEAVVMVALHLLKLLGGDSKVRLGDVKLHRSKDRMRAAAVLLNLATQRRRGGRQVPPPVQAFLNMQERTGGPGAVGKLPGDLLQKVEWEAAEVKRRSANGRQERPRRARVRWRDLTDLDQRVARAVRDSTEAIRAKALIEKVSPKPHAKSLERSLKKLKQHDVIEHGPAGYYWLAPPQGMPDE